MPNVCPEDKRCLNSAGSYSCQCPVGFTGAECTSKFSSIQLYVKYFLHIFIFLQFLGIPDAYIPLIVTLQIEYTASLNVLTSQESRALINELKAAVSYFYMSPFFLSILS